jgi:threonine synthase
MYALELFHGPTLAFKDVGARFMSQCLGYFMEGETKKVTVLVATSGDTGGAVANGFYGVEGVDVVILYPSGKVSNLQELQLTTLGKNITALEIDGTFDDCQRMVKAAFGDPMLNESLFLTSANSINVARWLPQQFYYFFAIPAMGRQKQTACYQCAQRQFRKHLRRADGVPHRLPVQHFVAACNANDSRTGVSAIRKLFGKAGHSYAFQCHGCGRSQQFCTAAALVQRRSAYHQGYG